MFNRLYIYIYIYIILYDIYIRTRKKMNICYNCKKEKLKQIGIQMIIGAFHHSIGKCECCGTECQELYSYKEVSK